MYNDMRAVNELVQQESAFVDAITHEVSKVIVGQDTMVERILIGLLSGGHVLLEGVPGLAKTLTVKTVCDTLSAQFSRIQFTPDLLPADVVCTTLYNQQSGQFSAKRGPVFANLVLADEVNRAPAKVQIMRGADEWWHPGRHGKICLGPKKVLGIFGELHPKVLREMDIKGPAVAFVIYPDEVPLPKNKTATRAALAITDLQAVERDFAFVVDADVEALTLVNAAAGADKALISDVRVFDEFIGGSLGEGKKSLAVTVRLQPTEKTLKDADIEAVSAKIVEKVAKATGGTLRG